MDPQLTLRWLIAIGILSIVSTADQALAAEGNRGTPFQSDRGNGIVAEHFMPNGTDGEREIWIRPDSTTSKPLLLYKYSRSAKVLFSPDLHWIVVNDAFGSGSTEIRLFQQTTQVNFRQRDEIDVGAKIWALLDKTTRKSISKSLDHRYVDAIRWSPNSRYILIAVSGHFADDVRVKDWLCVFDIRRMEAFSNLYLMNQNNIYIGSKGN